MTGPIACVALLALTLVGVAPAPAAADALEDALAAWLADDDGVALPALRDLATAGDERAMLFLGALERRPDTVSALAALPRGERNALLRAPGGLSGKSWLTRVVDEKDLAGALEAAQAADPAPLLRLDQDGAALSAVLPAFNRAPWALTLLDAQHRLPDGVRHLVWLGAALGLDPAVRDPVPAEAPALTRALAERERPEWSGGLQDLVFQASLADPAGVPPSIRLAGLALRDGEIRVRQNPVFMVAPGGDQDAALSAARAILMTAPEAEALRALCRRPCPEAPEPCVAALWSLTGAAASPTVFHTPLDRLVPPSAYAGSDRHLGEVRRMARAGTAALPGGIEACAQAVLDAG